jgi:hypothetical protein
MILQIPERVKKLRAKEEKIKAALDQRRQGESGNQENVVVEDMLKDVAKSKTDTKDVGEKKAEEAVEAESSEAADSKTDTKEVEGKKAEEAVEAESSEAAAEEKS